MMLRKPRQTFSRRLCAIESLENRTLLSDTKIAVIGDYGAQTTGEADVAKLVKSWSPSYVVTVGDNNYDGTSSIDSDIGQYYSQFIYPYSGKYGTGSADRVNHFFPAMGDHDWDSGSSTAYTNYFTLPGNERYYTRQEGNVAIFVVDLDPHEPDGNTPTSVQGNWLKSAMAASTAQWKLVIDFYPPYSSGGIGSNSFAQWPYKDWGATAVISGHDHDYERLNVGGLPYFVDGTGGQDIQPFATPISGSQVRYSGDYGAMLLSATDTSLNFQFINRSGKVIDNYSVLAAGLPQAPSNLTATAASQTQVNLTWQDNATNETGFKIERSTDGTNFTQIATVGANATTYSDSGLSSGTAYYYRVRATNAAGDSPYSNTASAITSGTTTYLSDLTWVSATSGWGPVEKDTSNGSNGTGDGRTMSIAGVTYTKGLGAHAISQIVYNINKQYGAFQTDVGVDDESFGTVDFQVMADGVKIYDSGTMPAGQAAQHVNLNVAGVSQLTLYVSDAGDGNSGDHADWAGAKLISSSGSPSVPVAPSNLVATAISTSQINLAFQDNSTNETGFVIERSSDGNTFSPLATTAANITTYTDAGLVAGTTYYYRVKATNAQGDSTYSNISNATTNSSQQTTTYLSDLTWVSATNGLGPVEKDTSVGGKAAGDGKTITIAGVQYAKGLGVRATSKIIYNLSGQYSTFLSDIGVDDESSGTVAFQVVADGVTIFSSGKISKGMAAHHVSLNVSGVKQLTLLVTGGAGGNNANHGDWAGARLIT